MRAAYTAHLTLLDLITLIKFVEAYMRYHAKSLSMHFECVDRKNCQPSETSIAYTKLMSIWGEARNAEFLHLSQPNTQTCTVCCFH